MRSAVVIFAGVVCAVLLCGAARADTDPYAMLLAPVGTCGPADAQLGLDEQTAHLTMLCLTNYARQPPRLSPLALNVTRTTAGDAKLRADVSCGIFSHEPCGQPFDTVFAPYTAGASAFQIGENIAWGTGSFGTPRSIMDAWLHSTGHRENILTPAFKELGIGYLSNQAFQGTVGAVLWSQQFGARTATAAPAATPKPVVKKKPLRKRGLRLRHR